jgi:hypothetical protein
MRGMRPALSVPVEAWCSVDEAAVELGVSQSRVSWLVLNGYLQAATDPDDRAGLTRESVAAEANWRQTASVWRRFRRAMGYAIKFLP